MDGLLIPGNENITWKKNWLIDFDRKIYLTAAGRRKEMWVAHKSWVSTTDAFISRLSFTNWCTPSDSITNKSALTKVVTSPWITKTSRKVNSSSAIYTNIWFELFNLEPLRTENHQWFTPKPKDAVNTIGRYDISNCISYSSHHWQFK